MSSMADAQRAASGSNTPPPREPEPVMVLRLIDRGLARVEETVLAICLLILILVGVYGAYKRNLAPPSPFWTDEIIRYTVFFLGLTGAALAAQSERLFNIDMFTRLLGVRWQLVIKILSGLFTIAVCYLLFASSLVFRTSLIGEAGELIPSEIAVLSIPIAMGLIAVHVGLHVLIALYYLATGQTPPELAAPKAGH